jgi:hypothetical protein
MLKVFASVCLAILFWGHAGPPAYAMSCDNRGAQDRLHFGSKVSGEKVTICAEYWWPPIVGKPKPAPKPVTPSAPQKVQPKFFVVTPQKPYAFTSGPQSILLGQEVAVATSAASHLRKNVLLGRLALVRFTPVRTTWSFGDGRKSYATRPTHSFLSPGLFTVRAMVSYSVRFRFVGTTTWLVDPRGINLQTNPLAFRVKKPDPKPKAGRPLLVLFDCQNIQRHGC